MRISVLHECPEFPAGTSDPLGPKVPRRWVLGCGIQGTDDKSPRHRGRIPVPGTVPARLPCRKTGAAEESESQMTRELMDLGSASVALAAQAECPVALVRPHVADDAPPDRGPVVLGVDGAPAGEDAIAIAFEEASWRQAPLVAIHCWHTGFLAEVFEEGGWTMDTIAIERHECELLAQRL